MSMAVSVHWNILARTSRHAVKKNVQYKIDQQINGLASCYTSFQSRPRHCTLCNKLPI